MSSRAKGFVAAFALVATGVVASLALPRLGSAGAPKMANEPAETEVFSVLQDEVVSLAYRTSTSTVTATRAAPGGHFAVRITFIDGRRPKQCDAPPDLKGLLGVLSVLTATRAVPPGQFDARFPKPLGTLSIRDRIGSESPVMISFRATPDLASVAASLEQRSFEVKTPAGALARLELICDAR